MPETNLDNLFEKNREWSSWMTREDPTYFRRLSKLQAPKYLWIGCADSRVPANEIVGLDPGELFVHRNVANVVVHTDLNCLSVIQFAVDVLKVQHIIVCGHYGCGGVKAALDDSELGLIENWLRHIEDVRNRHRAAIDALADSSAQCDRLCELNVIDQVMNVCRTTIVRDAWRRDQPITLHGVIYGLKDGLLGDLGLKLSGPDNVADKYEAALTALTERRG
ncbi:MAG: carbonate dehydratase [Algisphaera sp.]